MSDDTPDIPPGGVVDEFEGESFTQRELSLKADLALALGLDGTYQRGRKLVVIGTFEIDEIQHKTKGGKPTRVEKGSAVELFIVSDSTDALDLLQRARADRERALDELLGVQRLPLDDEEPQGPPEPPLDPESMTDEDFADGLREILDDESKTDDEVADEIENALDDPPPEEE
jgi:hypothetical protein